MYAHRLVQIQSISPLLNRLCGNWEGSRSRTQALMASSQERSTCSPVGWPMGMSYRATGAGKSQHKKTPDKRNHTVYGKKQEHSQANETTFTFSEPRLSKLSTKQISKRNRDESPLPASLTVNGNSQLSSSAVLAGWLSGCVHTRPFKSSSCY